ncbi:hypothetical protein BDZ91DRAFT_748597 [Kalaharituber pfeilii]|nr:hypothetical protein BDZ91DRAFT_748597 [Kalaharituber pfeilii]
MQTRTMITQTVELHASPPPANAVTSPKASISACAILPVRHQRASLQHICTRSAWLAVSRSCWSTPDVILTSSYPDHLSLRTWSKVKYCRAQQSARVAHGRCKL